MFCGLLRAGLVWVLIVVFCVYAYDFSVVVGVFVSVCWYCHLVCWCFRIWLAFLVYEFVCGIASGVVLRFLVSRLILVVY